MNCGVYIIKNTKTNRVYVGSSKNIKNRMRAHKYQLKNQKHHSTKLQRAWNKYGKDTFEFYTALVCEVKDLLFYEQALIDFYDAQKTGYNLLSKAGSREGIAHDKKTINKMKLIQRDRRQKYSWLGEMLCLAEIAEKEGVDKNLLFRRVCLDKWPLEKAVKTQAGQKNKLFSGFGFSLTAKQWADKFDCKESFIRNWIRKGASLEDCAVLNNKITPHEFARALGVDPKSFTARLSMGWSIADALTKPVKKSFTREQALEIRALCGTMKIKDIAEKYGVHVDTIQLIKSGKSFKEQANG